MEIATTTPTYCPQPPFATPATSRASCARGVQEEVARCSADPTCSLAPLTKSATSPHGFALQRCASQALTTLQPSRHFADTVHCKLSGRQLISAMFSSGDQAFVLPLQMAGVSSPTLHFSFSRVDQFFCSSQKLGKAALFSIVFVIEFAPQICLRIVTHVVYCFRLASFFAPHCPANVKVRPRQKSRSARRFL